MNYLIIGNGPAGVFAAAKLRSLDKNSSITIITGEDYPYYARPRLPELLCHDIAIEDTIIFNNDWYQKKNITLITSESITNIDRENKQLSSAKSSYHYDKLLLATGAHPFIPDCINKENPAIFTLRTIEDCQRLSKQLDQNKEVLVVGGGLLGLEIASRLAQSDFPVTVVENHDHLLARQLSSERSALLRNKLEEMGLKFKTNSQVTEIVKADNNNLVTFNNGQQEDFQMVVFSIGVRANSKLANDAGLNVNKAIVVNEFLQTDDPEIYAAGDCIEYQGKCWGYVRSASEQGKIAAQNMHDHGSAKYSGSDIKAQIKIFGIDLQQL